MKIENKVFSRVLGNIQVRDLEDFREIELTPQMSCAGKSLSPQVSFAVANEYNFLFIIHISMNEKSQYVFGYEIYSGDNGSTCYPKLRRNQHPQTETLARCILDALKYCKLSVYHYPKDRIKVIKAVNRATRLINECRLKQFTIFDML